MMTSKPMHWWRVGLVWQRAAMINSVGFSAASVAQSIASLTGTQPRRWRRRWSRRSRLFIATVNTSFRDVSIQQLASYYMIPTWRKMWVSTHAGENQRSLTMTSISQEVWSLHSRRKRSLPNHARGLSYFCNLSKQYHVRYQHAQTDSALCNLITLTSHPGSTSGFPLTTYSATIEVSFSKNCSPQP